MNLADQLSQSLASLNPSPLWLKLLMAALATWRVSSLLVNEDGPGDLLLKFRYRVGTHELDEYDRPLSNLGKLFACVWCMSVWVSVIVAVVAITPFWVVLIPLALSAVAILIQSVVRQ